MSSAPSVSFTLYSIDFFYRVFIPCVGRENTSCGNLVLAHRFLVSMEIDISEETNSGQWAKSERVWERNRLSMHETFLACFFFYATLVRLDSDLL